MISVIIPTYKSVKYLDLCLDSIIKHQVNQNEIIVILDGYPDLYTDVIKKYPMVSWLPFEQNMGLQTAINYGVWNASSEKIFIVNDDNIFPPNWDVRLEQEYHSHTIITVNQIEPTGPGMYNFPVADCGRTAETFDMEKFINIDKQLSRSVLTKDGNIFPFLINKRWFMAVGGFDTYYQSPHIMDWDFFAKLELIPTIGYSRTHALHLYHFGSMSTKNVPEETLFKQKEQFAIIQYEYKWKTPPYNGPNNTKHRRKPE